MVKKKTKMCQISRKILIVISYVIIVTILQTGDAKSIQGTEGSERVQLGKEENITEKTINDKENKLDTKDRIENEADNNDTKTMWSRFDDTSPVEDVNNKEGTKEGNAPEEISENEEAGSNRQKRSIVSMIQHHMFDVMRMTPSNHYRPMRPHDAFDFLRDNYPLPFDGIQKSYDFVVVGGGSAGAVIASRLSEGGRFTVLLLEAGGPENLIAQVPLLATYLLSTDYNWGYKMEKQEGICTAMNDQRCSWTKGKASGGSSVINYMIYTRGNRIDWDRIAADGNPGWSYDDVLPYYLKSEGARNLDGLENNTENHNKHGLLNIEYANYKSILVNAFLEAAKEKKHEIVDYNQGDAFGFSRVQCHTKDGWRHSSAKAFLNPFKTRRNLHVLPFSRVTKINIKNSTQTATSVEYIRNRIKYKVKAKKEIILSAGIIGSAQLLMLSGVGPKRHLEEIGIPVIKNLPVGQIMYDHFCFQGLVFLVNCTDCTIIETATTTAKNILDWFKFGQGPLTQVAGVGAIGFIKTNISDESLNYPDIEIVLALGGMTSDASHGFIKAANINEEFFLQVYGDIVEKPAFTITPMILHPKSKGYMKLKDNNPLHWPKFYYDYFSDRRDMLTLIEGVKYSIELTKTEAFQKYGAKLYDKPYPNCIQHPFGSDEYWECAIRSIGISLQHQISTCKMGSSEDPEAVVDNELRVHGIKRLRVGDASIIPKPLSAHTHAPSVMIGERLADFVKQIWQ